MLQIIVNFIVQHSFAFAYLPRVLIAMVRGSYSIKMYIVCYLDIIIIVPGTAFVTCLPSTSWTDFFFIKLQINGTIKDFKTVNKVYYHDETSTSKGLVIHLASR